MPSPVSVGSARRFVRDVLMSRQTYDGVVDVVELLTSEVVTAAVVHAGTTEELVITLGAWRVRVEVTHSAIGGSSAQVAKPAVTTERGLAIVEALAASWGVDLDDHGGARVWFEVPVRDLGC
jgi:Histidine kinase-like ATPase domain